MRKYIGHLIYKIKYCIFVVKYFEQPLRILKKQAKREKVEVAKLRKGGIFNTFGYGSAAVPLQGYIEYGEIVNMEYDQKMLKNIEP